MTQLQTIDQILDAYYDPDMETLDKGCIKRALYDLISREVIRENEHKDYPDQWLVDFEDAQNGLRQEQRAELRALCGIESD